MQSLADSYDDVRSDLGRTHLLAAMESGLTNVRIADATAMAVSYFQTNFA